MTSKLLNSKAEKVITPQVSNETLLECIEREGFDVGASCRSGYCGGCKVVVHDGNYEYKSTPLSILSDKECLPCICVPKGDFIIISK